MNAWWIIAIGFVAQGFFSARILVQWILSEKAHKVLSPNTFWIFSIIGSWLLCLYGWLRQDFAIVLGQFFSYYVYLYNLQLKGLFVKIPAIFRFLLLISPIVAILLAMGDVGNFIDSFFRNEDVPMWLLVFGSFGQILFTLRFLYQLWYSSRKGESVLPATFWWISLVGSSCIILYAVIRRDPVLIIGQSFGFVAYIRNLIIGRKASAHKTR